jgi:hypothetical protein
MFFRSNLGHELLVLHRGFFELGVVLFGGFAFGLELDAQLVLNVVNTLLHDGICHFRQAVGDQAGHD